jgi:hypothetical protein
MGYIPATFGALRSKSVTVLAGQISHSELIGAFVLVGKVVLRAAGYRLTDHPSGPPLLGIQKDNTILTGAIWLRTISG